MKSRSTYDLVYYNEQNNPNRPEIPKKYIKKIMSFYFFSVRERAEFDKSCNRIVLGTSGGISHLARSRRAESLWTIFVTI